IKKMEIINGKEKTSDTVYTSNSIAPQNPETDRVKSKRITIITDGVSDGNIHTIGGPGEITDKEIARVLKELGADPADIEKTIQVNSENKSDNGQPHTMTQIVIMK